MAVALLPGCSDPSPGTSITFWAMGREGEAVQELTAEYERRHPGVQVQVQQIPWNAAHEKLLTAYAGEVLPDLFQLGNTWVPEFAAMGAIASLDNRTLAAPAYQDYFPGILASCEVDGRLMALPWYVDTRLLFYRRDLLARAGFQQPPVDWAEWRLAMARIKARSGGGHALLLPVDEWQVPVILAMQARSALLRDGDRYGDFRGPAFRRAFAYYLDIFRQGHAPALAEAQMTNVYQDFALGRFAFYVTGPWNLREFERRLPATIKDQWATAPMPGPVGTAPGVSLAGGSSLAVSRFSRHPEAARNLAEFLVDPERMVEFHRLTGDLPARRSAWVHPALQQTPHTAAFRRQLEAVRPTPKIPEWERIAARIARYAELAVRGRMSEAAALAALDGDVDQILAKRRWLLDRSPRELIRP